MNFRLIPAMLCLSLSAGHAEPPAAPDFSDGFRQLAELGLPELDEKTKWVKLPGNPTDDRELRDVFGSMTGNGWVLENGTALAAGAVTSVGDAPRRPRDADLAEDVAALVEAIPKQRGRADDEYSLRWMQDGGPPYGTMLIFAAQLHQTGHTAEADRLAATIFNAAPTRQSVVDAAVDRIATPHYEEITKAFFADGDWQNYHAALVGHCERFPRGWEALPLVKRFLPQLAKQAAGEQPPQPEIPDVELDPRALEAIDALSRSAEPAGDSLPDGLDEIGLTAEQYQAMAPAMQRRIRESLAGMYGRGGSVPHLWLLRGPQDDPPSGAEGMLIALGMDAFPALAALTGDSHLLPRPNVSQSRGYYYYSSSESRAERLEQFYQSMVRPATRGDIARALLQATLPADDSSRGELDPATLRETALAFWRAHRGKSRDELALVFLREGSSSQRSSAAGVIATSDDEEVLAQFEEHILTVGQPFDYLDAVQAYVRSRKERAKPFFDRFAKLLTESIEALDESDIPWALRRDEGGVKAYLGGLRSLVQGRQPRAVARDIGRGDPEEAEEAIRQLWPLLEDLEPVKKLHALLEGAYAAKDAKVRGMFLAAALYAGGTEDENDREISDAEAAVWKRMLGDERNFEDSQRQLGAYGADTVAKVAALALETSASPGFGERGTMAAAVAGTTLTDVAMRRAEARLAGKEIPQYPDAAAVSEERLAEIVAKAGTLGPPEIHPYLSELSLDERAAWLEWLQGEDEPAVPASVRQLASHVIRRGNDQAWGFAHHPASGIEPGFVLTKESLLAWINAAAAAAEAMSRTSIWLVPAEFGPGLQIYATRAEFQEDDDEGSPLHLLSDAVNALGDAPETAEGAITCRYFGPEGNTTAAWLAEGGKATPQDAEALLEAIDAIASAERPPPLRISLQVITRADAETLNSD